MSDPLMDRLARLPAAEPEPERAARVRRRGRVALAGDSPPRQPHPGGPRHSQPVWPPALAIVGAVYMLQALMTAVGVYAAQ